MAANFYGAIALTGGGTGALDKIDGVNLADADGALVVTATNFYIYYLNASSGAGESSPDIISPDTNAGNKRWILIELGNIASTIHGVSAKATPVDADEIGLIDSAASWVLKKLTWINLKATLKTYFDSLYTKYPDTGEQAFLDADHSKLDAIEASADITDAVNVGSSTHGVANKAAPVNADKVPLIDTEDSNTLKTSTWTNIKAFLKTYFDSLYTKYPDTGEQAFLDADHTKLDGVASGADVTGSNAPQAHKASHQNAGADEISVTGLSGLLADDQHVLDSEVLNVADGRKCSGAIKIEDTFTLTNIAEQCVHGHRIIIGNYLYVVSESFRSGVYVAKIYKINTDDFTDFSSIAFATDAYHGGGSDLQYSENNDKLYAAFRGSGYISEIDPYTFSSYSDVITNTTDLGGCAIWIEGDYLYQISQTNPTKLYKYDLTDYSLTASNTNISPGSGHGIIASGNYLYGVNGFADGTATTVWKFNKSTLAVEATKTYSDIYGGSHDLLPIGDYLFFGLHGPFTKADVGKFIKIKMSDFNSYEVVSVPSDIVGLIIGTTYHGGYVWLTAISKQGALIRVDPDSLEFEVYKFPNSFPDFYGDYFYPNGPVVFDNKGQAISSFFPDIWDEAENVPGYLLRYTFSENIRPYGNNNLIIKHNNEPSIMAIDSAIIVASHGVTIDVNNGSSKGTITANSGTPYAYMFTGQKFYLQNTTNNDGEYTIDSVTDTVITTTTVIAGNDYSNTCIIRAMQNNRAFIQAKDGNVCMGGVNLDKETNADLQLFAGNSAKLIIKSDGKVCINGGQIAFPATAVPSAEANVLDDYEEGVWTPDLQFGGAKVGIIYTSQTGLYTKKGREVSITCWLCLTSKGSSNGDALIHGLPFTTVNSDGGYSAAKIWVNHISFADYLQIFTNKNATSVVLEEITNAGMKTALTDANFADNSEMILSLTYFV